MKDAVLVAARKTEKDHPWSIIATAQTADEALAVAAAYVRTRPDFVVGIFQVTNLVRGAVTVTPEKVADLSEVVTLT